MEHQDLSKDFKPHDLSSEQMSLLFSERQKYNDYRVRLIDQERGKMDSLLRYGNSGVRSIVSESRGLELAQVNLILNCINNILGIPSDN